MSPPVERKTGKPSDRPGGSGGDDRTRLVHVSPFRAGVPADRHGGPTDDGARNAFRGPLFTVNSDPVRVWESLSVVVPESACVARHNLVTAKTRGPAANAFDVLRTRLMQGMEEKGWTRLAITSPTHGCGKSFTAINLAFSCARRASFRTVLVDLELRNPALAGMLGVTDAHPLTEFLGAEQPLESHLRRIGDNLALCLNSTPLARPAETLQEDATAEAFASLHDALSPDLVIYDMPPALVCADVIAFAPQLDAVLLVVDGTRSTADDVRRTERLLEGRIPLMGVILNRAQDGGLSRYSYGGR